MDSFEFLKRYLFIWLCQVLVRACRIFSFGMQTLSCITWDLVPWSGIKPGPTALGVRSLSHWTTREVPDWILSLKNLKMCMTFMETNWKCEHQLDSCIVFRKYCKIFRCNNSAQWLCFKYDPQTPAVSKTLAEDPGGQGHFKKITCWGASWGFQTVAPNCTGSHGLVSGFSGRVEACRAVVPGLGVEPLPPEAQSPNHQTTREVPGSHCSLHSHTITGKKCQFH